MKKKYYHATELKNVQSIMENGLYKNLYGVIYLCDSQKDAYKFMLIHLISKFAVIEVELDDKDVSESRDHNEKLFKCKTYIYDKDIPYKDINSIKFIELK